MTSPSFSNPLGNFLKKNRPVEVSPQAEKMFRGLNDKEGVPMLLPQIKEMIKEEMFKHDTTDKLHTFHWIPVDHLMALIDNGKHVIRIPKVMTKPEFVLFINTYNSYITDEVKH